MSDHADERLLLGRYAFALAVGDLNEALIAFEQDAQRAMDVEVRLHLVMSTAYTLEEHLVTLAAERWPRKTKPYYRFRDDSSDGQVVAGLIYARGLATHHLASLGEPGQSGFGTVPWGSGPFGGGLPEMRWLPLVDLPRPGKKETHRRDEMYSDHLAGRPVQECIPAAHRFLLEDAPEWLSSDAEDSQAQSH